MAGPIALAAAFARTIEIKCPWCGYKKLAARQPVAYRVCPRCKKHFPDPLTKRKRR